MNKKRFLELKIKHDHLQNRWKLLSIVWIVCAALSLLFFVLSLLPSLLEHRRLFVVLLSIFTLCTSITFLTMTWLNNRLWRLYGEMFFRQTE